MVIKKVQYMQNLSKVCSHETDRCNKFINVEHDKANTPGDELVGAFKPRIGSSLKEITGSLFHSLHPFVTLRGV